MSDVVRFRGAAERDADLVQRVAQEIIDALGPSAGLELGQLARSKGISDPKRARLLAIADEIAARQGFGWYFADEAS